MEVLAIIQARMGSSRLPGKVLLDLNGKTVLERVLERVRSAAAIDKVMVATTDRENDNAISAYCEKSSIAVFRGSENDVLDRYYRSALLFGPKHIVRITADCPLMDPLIIDRVVNAHISSGNDYTTNTLQSTYPDGEDVEVFTWPALKTAWNDARLVSEREHVTPYIRNNRDLFKVSGIESPVDHGNKRWTLDEARDYEFIKAVYSEFKKEQCFGMREILELLERKPELENLNSGIVRNEGYTKSLQNDRPL